MLGLDGQTIEMDAAVMDTRGTLGAVVRDADGHFAVAGSTGGSTRPLD